ncbi:MAG: hypothetical protein ACI9EB_000150 [Pseudomonas sp.]|jgi:hypothetical protein
MELVHKALLLVTDEPCERIEAVRAYALEHGIELREVSEQTLLAEPRSDFAGISHLLAVVSDE